ncbi:hypothetical protein ACFSQD_18135 [Flavihumibacter stibioxidans]|uniref:Lipoprotein n=1 Tax=Flavihumibacter stibioxidans TaxID=1834163 RepID=A0ABR7M6R6_9BACT|nr:hypothetical protein [Flavihumibacter stibioxidans]MBC6490652.1 hypothetical protein [Flavihumibacter stibioxidans]
MKRPKNRFISIVLMFCVVIFFSCKMDDNSVEKALISDFPITKPYLDTVIKYVVNKYYDSESTKSYNRLQFILGEKAYHNGSIFSDMIISNFLRQTSVVDISFEKGSFCLDKYAYDFVRFKLKAEGNFQYYYVYEFCPLHQNAVSTPNFKSIPIDQKWSLQIEKN